MDMQIPDTLQHKLELFANRGRVIRRDDDLFAENNWMAILLGQGLTPRGYDPQVDALPWDDVLANMARIRDAVRRVASGLPTHQAFIDQFCKAPDLV